MKRQIFIITSLLFLGISGCGQTDTNPVQNVEVESREVETSEAVNVPLGEIMSKVNGDWQIATTSFTKEALDEIAGNETLLAATKTLQGFVNNEIQFDYDKSVQGVMNDYSLSGSLEDMKKQYAQFWITFFPDALKEETADSLAEKTDVSYKIVSDKDAYDIVVRLENKENWFMYPFDVVLKQVENKWIACLECANSEGKSFYYLTDGVVQLNVKVLVEEGEKRFYCIGNDGKVSLAYTLTRLGLYRKANGIVYIYDYSEDADVEFKRFVIDGEEIYVCDDSLREVITELADNPVIKSQDEVAKMILECYEKLGIPPISD